MKEPKFRAIVSEWRQTEAKVNVVNKYGISAVMVFQFHLFGRLDDCCKWLRTNLRLHDTYPNMALKAKLCWGKNVHEECNAPWQHMFGCMDWIYCCHSILECGWKYSTQRYMGYMKVPLYLLSVMNCKMTKCSQRL